MVLAFRADGRVHLRVNDDGRGAASLDGGFGLTGIRERAEQLGGSVAYHTRPRPGLHARHGAAGVMTLTPASAVAVIADDQALFREGLRTLLSTRPKSRSSAKPPTATRRWRMVAQLRAARSC